jgi:hypothetical protein
MDRRNRFSPEDELLLLLARGTLTPEVRGKALAYLEQGLSWPLILKQALAHDLSPLLYRNLLTLDFPGVPAEARTALDRVYRINIVRNLLLGRELTRLLQAFSAAEIPVVPLKGVTLAEALYGDPALRICTDIDILVPRQIVPKAFDLLLTAGYSADCGEGFIADLLLRHDIEYTFVRREKGFLYRLELHWGVLWGPRLDSAAIDDLWAEARPQAFSRVPAYALSREWELLFLAVHAARHRWQQLKWIVDIHEICLRGGIDWEKLGAKATRLGWEELLQLSLSASFTLFSTPIPNLYLRAAHPSWLPLFPAGPSSSDSWDGRLFAIRLLRRRSDKLRYLIRVLLVPTLAERYFLRLPSFLGFLYYPLRPLRLGCKWGWRVVCAVTVFFLGRLWRRKDAGGAFEMRPAPLHIQSSTAEGPMRSTTPERRTG